MDQSEEAAFTVVENLWKKSFDISKNSDDPLFSLYTKSFETIMVYMSQSLDYEYIEKEINSLDKDRQLALQLENGYDAHRCLSFGLIEAVQMMMKKNTKKLEEMIKQGYIPVPEIPKFPLEPKEENMEDPEPIPAGNEFSSPSFPQEIAEQPIDDFAQDFPAADQTSPLASIEQDFDLKEEEMMDNDVNAGIDDFAPEIDNTLNESPLEDKIMDESNGTFAEESDLVSVKKSSDNNKMMNDVSSNQILNHGRKSTRKVARPAKNNSMEDSDEKEVEPNVKKTRFNSAEKSGEDSSQVKCMLCEVYPKTLRDYVNHLSYHKDKSTLNANGIYLVCSCGDETVCDGVGFTVHNAEDKIRSTPQCILCESYPTNVYKYAEHLTSRVHKSSLMANGIYLRCSCGFKVRSTFRYADHNEKCDGLHFTLHKTEDEVHSTPQCILCEKYPKTTYGYALHLVKVHKSTLNSNGIYLLCSCGVKVRSADNGGKHNKECDSVQYTLHQKEDEVHSTPQCVICETYPTTAQGYATHLRHLHKSTLNANGIYLLCSCGFKIRSVNSGLNHSKECDQLQFSVHKKSEE